MIRVAESDLHRHLRERMAQRGVSKDEIEKVLNDGWEAQDAKSDTLGKTMVFAIANEALETPYSEKEVTVYYKHIAGQLILLTVKARYGQHFSRGEAS